MKNRYIKLLNCLTLGSINSDWLGLDMFKMVKKKGDATFLWSFIKLNRSEMKCNWFGINISFDQYLFVACCLELDGSKLCLFDGSRRQILIIIVIILCYCTLHTLFLQNIYMFLSRYSYNFRPNEEEYHENTQRWTFNRMPSLKYIRSLHINRKK